MLSIDFKVDKDILAREMISKNRMPTEYANYLWEKFNNSYMRLQKNVCNNRIDLNILYELQNQKFFDEQMKKAKNNLARIKQNWLSNQEKINCYLTKVMKVDFNLKVQCFIVSPELNEGLNIGNNCVIWGDEQGTINKNHDLVYLVHESLHSFFDRNLLTHTIIEKIADIELCKILSNSSTGYPVHTYTQDNHVKIFPFWNLYMNRSKDEIKKEQINENIKYDIDKFEIYRDSLSKMNINEFILFLQDKIEEVKFKQYYEII